MVAGLASVTDGLPRAAVVVGFLGAAGLLLNAAVNQGVWLVGDVVVQETVLGRSEIRLEDISSIHVNESQTLVLVETGGVYVQQSIATPAGFSGDGDREAWLEAFASKGVAVRSHSGFSSLLELSPRVSASTRRGAIGSTLRQPLVYGLPGAGLAVVALSYL